MKARRAFAAALIGAGALLVGPQLVADYPWQPGVCAGMLIIFVGALVYAETLEV